MNLLMETVDGCGGETTDTDFELWFNRIISKIKLMKLKSMNIYIYIQRGK